MSKGGHPSWQEIAAVGVSVGNVCLMAVAAFYRRTAAEQSTASPWRVKSGYVAVSLGLCSQLFYCVMLAAWRYGWVPLNPGSNSVIHLEEKLSNVGGVLSMATFWTACFGTGLRRWAGIWVAVTTFVLWSMVGLGVALSKLFR